MNCKQLRAGFEERSWQEIRTSPAFSNLAAHLAACPECNQFVAARRQVDESLRLVRDTASGVSASLDSSVLADYRRTLTELARSGRSGPEARNGFPGGLRWSIALGFAALVACAALVLFFSFPHRAITARKNVASPVASETPSLAQTSPGTSSESAPAKTAEIHQAVRRNKTQTPLARRDEPLPAAFQNLMYCDQISCSGAMEVIRVQLNGSRLLPAQRMPGNGGAVFADILVGPDGIARGIRVEE